MALPKKNRLTGKKDIDHVFKNGKTVKGSFLFVRFLNTQKKYSRFVFVIPAKYISLAVNRNRIKRLFSEEARRLLPLLGDKYDIVVLLSKKTNKNDYGYLVKELKELLFKLRTYALGL